MKKVCILMVLLTYVYQDARFRKRKVRQKLLQHRPARATYSLEGHKKPDTIHII